VDTVDLIASHQHSLTSRLREVIVASHRGPVEHQLTPDGEFSSAAVAGS
jgi:hypothetical protein